MIHEHVFLSYFAISLNKKYILVDLNTYGRMLLISSELSVTNHFVQSSHIYDFFPFLITKKRHFFFLIKGIWKRGKQEESMSGELKDRLSVCILIWQLSCVIFFLPKDC